MRFRTDLWIPVAKEAPSLAKLKSHKLLIRGGYFSQMASGIFSALPLGNRVMEKMEKVVDDEMQLVLKAEKTRLPLMLSADSWKKTGRWEKTGEELFRLKDRRGNDFCLGPTHEETVTDLVASFGQQSHKTLPIKLYQITQKYRDEIRPRFGLMRGREFMMKDMYSFHADQDDNMEFYSNVCDSYENILNTLGLNYAKVWADTGNIGGSYSHEYHVLADVGEDDLVFCDTGNYAVNSEVFDSDDMADIANAACTDPSCSCNQTGTLRVKKGIEIGHCFILGTTYSSTLKAMGVSADSKRFPLNMGCYGLGLSRMIAASIESYQFSPSVNPDEDSIVWPKAITPYEMVIMTAPGKAADRTARKDQVFSDILPRINIDKSEVVIDNRWNESLGLKRMEAKLIGYTWVVLVGKKGIEVTHQPSSSSFSISNADQLPEILAKFN